jgi:hypothetical protein
MRQSQVGAHVYWTRPRGPDAGFASQLERAVVAASALMWQASNGPVWLFTDTRGRDEVERRGLAPLWDKINVSSLDSVADDIDAAAFWDLGKTIVLNELPLEGFVLDLDLVIWQELEPTPDDAVVFLHWETPVMPWYPVREGLSTPPNYEFDPRIDWDAPVCNTAIISCPDQHVRTAFLGSALEFARRNKPPGTGIAEMLFSGQRMLGHTLRITGVRPLPVIDYLFAPFDGSRWLRDLSRRDDPLGLYACGNGEVFTHLWNQKHLLRDRPAAAAQFCQFLARRCIERAGDVAYPWLSVLNPFEELQ